MSSKSLPTIELDCRPPALLRSAAVLACVTAAFIPLLVIPTPWSLAGSLACITVMAVICYRSQMLGGHRVIRHASWTADGQWCLEDAGGSTIHAQLRGDSRVFADWVWLRWDTPFGRRQAVVLREAGQADAVRRLATRLRLKGIVPEANPDPVRL